MMEAPTLAVCAALCLLTITLVLLSNHLVGRRHKLNLPPGPKPWPIIGNLNLIGPLPHRSLHDLSKKYGPIMMLWYGSVPVLVGSSVEMAKLFLKTHDDVFAGRPQLAAGKYTSHEYSGILWSQHGPYLSQVRKMCLAELFSSKRIQSFEYMRVEELNSFLRGIFQLSLNGKPISLRDHLNTLNINIMSRMVLGKKYLDEEESSTWSISEFQKLLGEWFLLNGLFNLGDWIPSLKYLDVQGYEKRMKAWALKFDKFLEHVLDEHRARREREKENWVAKDVVDVLLELANDPKLEIKLETKGIKGITQDLFIGGSETSSLIIEWAMSELLRQPALITKAIDELDQVIGRKRWVVEKDIQNLPYICAIAKETMRLHPAAPTLVAHFSKGDVQIQGYDIPKGSMVLVNTFATQRDPNVYERPDEFCPERFIEKNIDVKGQHFELLPFGSGRRMCPGYSHALKVVEKTLANLLHGFIWKLPNNMKHEDLDMEETFGITIPKMIPLVACVEPRLTPHLYHTL